MITSIEPLGKHERRAFSSGSAALDDWFHLRAGQDEKLIRADHIISATGYEADVDRLTFLSPKLAADVKRIERAPELSPSFESSVAGLYFVGPVAAFSFGPLVRFVAGATFTVPRVSRHIVKSLKRQPSPVPTQVAGAKVSTTQ